MSVSREELLEAGAFKRKLLASNELVHNQACGLILGARGEGGKLEFIKGVGQQCHSGITGDIRRSSKWNEIGFSVAMNKVVEDGIKSGRYANEYYPWISWFNYLSYASPVRQVFSTMRDLTVGACCSEGLFPVDLDKAPANVTMWAMMVIRHLWESGIKEWPERFYRLSNSVCSQDLAFLIAPYFAVDNGTGTLTYRPIDGNTNHMVFVPSAIDMDYVENFLNGRWTNIADKTITAGGDYLDAVSKNNDVGEPRWNCYSLFSNNVITPSAAMSKRNGEWMKFLSDLSIKHGARLSVMDIRQAVQKLFPEVNLVGPHG